jgi:hypothetical protein
MLKERERIVGGNQEDEKTDIDLSTMLNILDGIRETPGRIIIISTNDPASLDPAFLRPGRFDIFLTFKKHSTEVLQRHIEAFFDCKLGEKQGRLITQFRRELDYKWTPAEVAQVLFNNLTSIDRALEVLIEKNPKEEFRYSYTEEAKPKGEAEAEAERAEAEAEENLIAGGQGGAQASPEKLKDIPEASAQNTMRAPLRPRMNFAQRLRDEGGEGGDAVSPQRMPGEGGYRWIREKKEEVIADIGIDGNVGKLGVDINTIIEKSLTNLTENEIAESLKNYNALFENKIINQDQDQNPNLSDISKLEDYIAPNNGLKPRGKFVYLG